MVGILTEKIPRIAITVPLTIGDRLPASPDGCNIPSLESTQVTLQGNPAAGIVHHLGDRHNSIYGNDLEDLIDCGQRNAALLRELAVLSPNLCFLEGYSKGTDMQAYVADSDGAYEKLQLAFPARVIPDQVSESQAFLLGNLGLASVVHFFFPNMLLYGTGPIDDRVARLGRNQTDPSIQDAITLRYRETVALAAISEKLQELPESDRVAALVYGVGHNFALEDIPITQGPHNTPLVVKYTFEKWSITDDTNTVIEAKTIDDQLAALSPGFRIYSFAWDHALSDKVQYEMAPLLKANPDTYPSPEDFLERISIGIREGPMKGQVEERLKNMYKLKSGPFADLNIRPGSRVAFDHLKCGMSASSLSVWGELHPYTQLELIRRAPRLAPFCFPGILTEKGQLEALEKLVLNPNTPLELYRDKLLSFSSSSAVDYEIRKRFAAGEALCLVPK